MLTFEGAQILGAEAIAEKLTVCSLCFFHEKCFTDRAHLQGLSFTKVQHQVTTLDAQPSSQSAASLIVSVTGQLIVRFPTWGCSPKLTVFIIL